MKEKVANHIMTGRQIAFLAYQTCEWWNEVIIQGRRFLRAFNSDHWIEPWEEKDSECSLNVERVMLAITIHHAIEDLEKLNIEMSRAGDHSLQVVLDAIDNTVPLQNIHDLRNMNEHGLEYMIEEGNKQKQFVSIAENNGYSVKTNAHTTVCVGEAKLLAIGNVNIDKLLLAMKEQLPFVRQKTKEIFEQEIVKD